jgi:NAD+ synthase
MSFVASVTTEEAVAALALDPAEATRRIVDALREQVGETLKRRGLVVGISGGVDSSLCAALAVRALGSKRVFGLFMPELDSDPDSLTLATSWARQLGIESSVEDISAILDACGCYRRRDEAIRRLVPDFGDGWRCKIVLGGNRLDSDRLNVFHLVVESPDGNSQSVRLPAEEYRTIVAATNFKQRVRKMMEYYHADRLHYAVLGTPNRLEYDQGFFVKGGDGLADVKPIAHLYKCQVYQLAQYVGVPDAVVSRPSTTDTYSLPQSQEEFYFSLPMPVMDRILYAHNTGVGVEEAAHTLGYGSEQIERAYREIDRKRATTRYLHAAPLLIEDVAEVSSDHPNRVV